MFFELSKQKIAPMLAIGAVMGAGLTFSIGVNNSSQATTLAQNYFGREVADANYLLSYKLPAQLAAAVSGTPVPTATSTPASGDARAIPVLLYHGTPPEGNDNPPLPQSVFVEQLQALKADGWNTITMAQFTAFMKDGTPLPAKSFLLTFDDGRKESFYPADPVVQDLGFHAVMFVITGFSLNPTSKNSTYYLSQSELEYMVQSGRWELESHGDEDHSLYNVPTATSTAQDVRSIVGGHFLSDKFWDTAAGRLETTPEFTARVTNDLTQSKETLEQDFGISVTAFAYPFNDYGQDSVNFSGSQAILNQVIPSIYTFAFYQVDPTKGDAFNYPDPNAYMIKRIEPTGDMTGADLVNILDQGNAKALPYAATTFSAADWAGSWGSITAQNGTLTVAATPQTTGGETFLNGSQWWTNYSFEATVAPAQGEASIIARYNQTQNSFVSCTLEPDDLVLEEHTGTTQTTIARTSYSGSGAGTVQMQINVEGDSATCTAGGTSVAGTVSSSFATGGVGVGVWSANPGVARMQVESVHVSAS